MRLFKMICNGVKKVVNFVKKIGRWFIDHRNVVKETAAAVGSVATAATAAASIVKVAQDQAKIARSEKQPHADTKAAPNKAYLDSKGKVVKPEKTPKRSSGKTPNPVNEFKEDLEKKTPFVQAFDPDEREKALRAHLEAKETGKRVSFDGNSCLKYDRTHTRPWNELHEVNARAEMIQRWMMRNPDPKSSKTDAIITRAVNEVKGKYLQQYNKIPNAEAIIEDDGVQTDEELANFLAEVDSQFDALFYAALDRIMKENRGESIKDRLISRPTEGADHSSLTNQRETAPGTPQSNVPQGDGMMSAAPITPSKPNPYQRKTDRNEDPERAMLEEVGLGDLPIVDVEVHLTQPARGWVDDKYVIEPYYYTPIPDQIPNCYSNDPDAELSGLGISYKSENFASVMTWTPGTPHKYASKIEVDHGYDWSELAGSHKNPLLPNDLEKATQCGSAWAFGNLQAGQVFYEIMNRLPCIFPGDPGYKDFVERYQSCYWDLVLGVPGLGDFGRVLGPFCCDASDEEREEQMIQMIDMYKARNDFSRIYGLNNPPSPAKVLYEIIVFGVNSQMPIIKKALEMYEDTLQLARDHSCSVNFYDLLLQLEMSPFIGDIYKALGCPVDTEPLTEGAIRDLTYYYHADLHFDDPELQALADHYAKKDVNVYLDDDDDDEDEDEDEDDDDDDDIDISLDDDNDDDELDDIQFTPEEIEALKTFYTKMKG